MQLLFGSKEDALCTLKEMNAVCLLKKCPVFKENCKGEICHSYFSGCVNITGVSKFRIQNPGCFSPLVTGVIEHQEN